METFVCDMRLAAHDTIVSKKSLPGHVFTDEDIKTRQEQEEITDTSQYYNIKKKKKDTYGSASIIGKAVSWILDGRLKPMPYTP